jgi:hypothetical protein
MFNEKGGKEAYSSGGVGFSFLEGWGGRALKELEFGLSFTQSLRKQRLDIHIEGTSWVARNVAIW